MVLLHYKVFLDTNIYDGANYSFRNALFTALKNRAQAGNLELHINSVVEGEVRQHINSNIKKAAKELLDAVRNPVLSGFKNIPGFADKIQIENPKEWAQKAVDEFDLFLTDCSVKRISTNGVDVERILDDYFANPQKAPFESKKPEEFKDAIAVESIICELSNLQEGEIYCVISDDNGFRQAIKDKAPDLNNLLRFQSLFQFINFLTMMDEKAIHFKKFLDDGGAEEEIIEGIKVAVQDASFSIDKYGLYSIDELDVIDVDEFEYEASVIDIDDDIAQISVSAKCVVTIWYKYTDEDESYWDSEEQAYLWQKIVELQEKYNLSFDLELSFNISEWLPGVEEKQEVEFNDYIDIPSMFELDEDELIETEDLSEPEYIDEPEGYSICPDCGCNITLENDGGNGFCTKCAPNH